MSGLKRIDVLSASGAKLSDKALDRFVGHTLEMRSSPAWLALPDNSRRALDRLERQHLLTAGLENGRLIVTYDQFVEAGIRRSSVREAIEIPVALGFAEITQRGYAVKGKAKVPSRYRLTYVKNLGRDAPAPTDEWRRFRHLSDARMAIREVRRNLAIEQDQRRANKLLRDGLADDGDVRGSPGVEVTI